MLISWMVTHSSCLIWQIFSFILPPNEYGCVYAWTMLESGSVIFLQKMQILEKNHLLRWRSFWSWRVCKQAKLSHLVHRKTARILWQANAPKTNHYLVRILVQRPFFFENEQGEADTVNDDHYRAMLNEFLFTKIEEEHIGNIWFQQDCATCHTAKATPDFLCPVFEDRIISRKVNVVWPPRSCDLTLFDYYL